MQPVLARMRNLTACSPELEERVQKLGLGVDTVAAKTLLGTQDAPDRRPRFLLSGWACRCRYLPDGRRQIFSLVLPGDGLGVFRQPQAIGSTYLVALTPLGLVDATPLRGDSPHDDACGALFRAQAYAEEERTLRQVMRLGRMNAVERLADLFLELHERLEVVGQTEGLRFACPLTQETLADMTGLSVVHVNRTLQELRRQGGGLAGRGWAQLGPAHLPAGSAGRPSSDTAS